MKRPKVTCVITLMLVVATAIPLQLAAQQRRYRVVDLGTFGGPGSSLNIPDNYALVQNNSGTVVGWADTSTHDPFPGFSDRGFLSHAFQWRNGVLSDLGTLPGNTSSAANWVSENGLIAGTSRSNQIDPLIDGFPQHRAVLWFNRGSIDLGTLDGGHESFGHSVNSRGQVVGAAFNSTPDSSSMFGQGFETRAFFWQNGDMQDLGTLGGRDAVAVAINELGQVIGESYTGFTPSPYCAEHLDLPLATGAFLWDKGAMVDLGNFGGTCTFASALNNRGQVVGVSTLHGDVVQRAFLWDRGVLRDLGTFGGDITGALTLNEAGDVVGFSGYPGNEIAHAFLWRDGELTDLGTLNGDPVSASFDINARGQIIGITIDADGNFHPFLWERGGPMIDLNTFVPPESGLQLDLPAVINDRGEISLTGHLASGEQRSFLMIPCGPKETDGCYTSAAGANSASVKRSPKRSAPDAVSKGLLNPMRRLRPMLGMGRFKAQAKHDPSAGSAAKTQSQANAVGATNMLSGATASTCPNPTTSVVTICSPADGATVPTTFHLSAAGSSSVTFMEVWMDGTKKFQNSGNHVETDLTVTAGSHTLTAVVRNSTGILGSKKIYLTVTNSGTCEGGVGVRICSPAAGSTVTSPVHVTAVNNTTYFEMFVSIDGVLEYRTTARHVDVELSTTVGPHALRVCAVTVAGITRGFCSSASFTVIAGSSCSAPASAGVHVCSPVDGSSVASPVHALARGLVSGTFARMELWVDGVKKSDYPTTVIDTYVPLGAGSHRFNFRAVNTSGTIWSNVVYATVQ